MIELVIIKLILKTNIYNKYKNYININNKELNKILYSLKTLIENNNKEIYTIEDLEVQFFTDYPFLRSAEKDSFSAIFERLRSVEVDESLAIEYLKRLQDSGLARQIAEIALDVSEGRKDFKEILDHVEKIETIKPVMEEFNFVSDDLEELYQGQVATAGLRWRLNCLNRSLGSLRRGDFGFVFARPETGKTTFLASEVTNMAQQATRPILWFNNEEQGSKVMLRCYQAALGITLSQLYSNISKYKAQFYELTKHNIKIIDAALIHKHDVEALCKQYDPSLIIFDQIDKIKGFAADRNDLMLGAIYQWGRELAKTYAPVIAVCQADGSGEGVKRLNMGHVADAKTAKQAEADWILGIGKTNEEGMEYVRYFNISKNKLAGDEDSDPGLRHGQPDVIIRPEIARYEDI